MVSVALFGASLQLAFGEGVHFMHATAFPSGPFVKR